MAESFTAVSLTDASEAPTMLGPAVTGAGGGRHWRHRHRWMLHLGGDVLCSTRGPIELLLLLPPLHG